MFINKDEYMNIFCHSSLCFCVYIYIYIYIYESGYMTYIDICHSDDAIQFDGSTQFNDSAHSKEPTRWCKELGSAKGSALLGLVGFG